MQGLGKKNTTRRVEIFFRPAREALAGGKKGALAFFSQRHRFPAYTLTLAREHGVKAGTKIGTFEPRRDGTKWLEETIKPRKWCTINYYGGILLDYYFFGITG